MNFVISLFGGFKSKMVKKHINLIVTGSSQANKALELYQLLKTEFDINVIVSENAKHFVHFPDDVVIYDKLYDTDQYEIGDETDSIIFRTNVALNLVYPATVDFIAKITHGIANDLPTTLFAIANAMVPTLIFPGHHTNFEKSPFYQRNIQIIHNTNPMVKVYDTFYGVFPDGEEGHGRVYDPQDTFDEVKRVLKYNDWK
jgi:phosphopantothenoylcysteine decarboxylase/phosphopantothenate--cysteine ligase